MCLKRKIGEPKEVEILIGTSGFLKKSCSYLDNRRAATTACQRYGFYDRQAEDETYGEAWIVRSCAGEWQE